MFRDEIEKNKSIKKMIKKITLKIIGTKLDIKIQWKEMLQVGIEEKNKSRKWFNKKIAIKRAMTKFDKKN
jgi:hypothetical protein